MNFIATTWETIKRPFNMLGGGGSATEDQARISRKGFKQSGVAAGEAFKRGLDSHGAAGGRVLSVALQRAVTIFSTPIPVTFQFCRRRESATLFAGGGMVRGPGTATSDSILALAFQSGIS